MDFTQKTVHAGPTGRTVYMGPGRTGPPYK